MGEIGPNRVSSFSVVRVEGSSSSSSSNSDSESGGLSLALRQEDEDEEDMNRNSASSAFGVTASAIFFGVFVIAGGSFLVAIQRFGGVNLRQLSRMGFDKIVGAATKTAGGSGLKNSSGAYHPMGDGFGLSSGKRVAHL